MTSTDTARKNSSSALQGYPGLLTEVKKRIRSALYDATKPIGVATYQITKTLPKTLKGQLPFPNEIAQLLEEL